VNQLDKLVNLYNLCRQVARCRLRECERQPKPSRAETIGRLNQKFFERRVVIKVSAPLLESRVFSKNFLRQPPDGTTQASGWRVTHSIPTLRQAQGERVNELSIQ
jgi:hypothetical protein